jgi:RND family efflux transporter MFP subunit
MSIAVLPLVFVNTGCIERAVSAAGAREPIPVRVYRAGIVNFTDEQRYAATTEPIAQVDLAFRAAGEVMALYQINGRPLEPGDTVPAGAVLAQLRATEFEARVHAAEAQLADAEAMRASAAAQVREARAANTHAEADLRRGEALYKADAMTRVELDGLRAKAEEAAARLAAVQTGVDGFDARIRAANAVREESGVRLGDTTLTAPFPAVVVARRVEVNSSVTGETVAYALADLRQVRVSFGVPDVALRHFPVGSAVRVNIDALPETRYAARVLSIAPLADPSTRLFRVLAVALNPGGLLKAGMVASVAVDAPEPVSLPAVPLRAVRRLGEGDRFAVLTTEGDTLQSRPVTLGPTQGALIGIASGLSAGEAVAVDAGMRLNAGDRVRVVPLN